MLNSIVRFSLRRRAAVIALAAAAVIYGFYTLERARYDVFPEFAPPIVSIQTEAPGLSPEQVELLVTQPIENQINGVTGIESLRSGSIQGLSVITVTFESGTDVLKARQLVAERLAALAGRLPEAVEPPLMTPLTSSTSTVLVFGLTSGKRSLMELRTLADWTVRPRLLAVAGVADMQVFGGAVKQFQIRFRPERLVRHDLSVDDVLAAARRATGIRGAGFIDTVNQRIVLQSQGQAATAARLASTVVAHKEGMNVRLGDVADVVEGEEPPFSAASVMGTPGLVCRVTAQYGANTLEITAGVEKALAGLHPLLEREGVRLDDTLFRPAAFIETSLRNMRFSLEVGAILVIAVLVVFLFNVRTAAISCTAIPLSLLIAVIVMSRAGMTLNTMTLGGLAIAIGEVVDDAVIDVENILRRLRGNRRSERPRPAVRVVLEASIEVRSAVVYATFAVILVFVPVLTMSGLAGRIFSPLGIAYILAILASLLVALTVTPALCLVFLRSARLSDEEPPLVRWSKRRYRGALLRIETHPRIVIGAVVLFTVLGVSVLPFFRERFLPQFREEHFIGHLSAVPGTSLDESLRLGRIATEKILKLPFVRSVAQRVGRAEAGEDILGTHQSEIEIELKPGSGRRVGNARAEIRNTLAGFPGAVFTVETFLSERIAETISGFTAPVVIDIYGPDLDVLDRLAGETAQVLGRVPGATEVQLQSPPGAPQLTIELRPDDLARWGFDPVSVLDAVRTAFNQETTGEVYQGNRIFEVAVVLAESDRRNIDAVGNLPVRSPSGVYVPLARLADIYEKTGRYSILHEGARRVQTITCNAAGGDVSSFVREAKARILEKVPFPAGTYVQFAGTAEAEARSRRELLVHSGLAGLGIILLLSIVMMNGRNLLLVLVNLPFALVGGVLTILAMGGVLSLGTLVGFVTLFGITLRNSIMMISHYEHLVAVEGMQWGPEAALRGATERLAPILMTALVTGLGLLPLALGSGSAGREIEGPMAAVILGGLFTSTALNLLVLPTLVLRYGRFEKPEPEE
jgi:CzcA family heavy metal efflux pump